MLNVSNRKKLTAALAASGRMTMTEAQAEEAALALIEGKTKDELCEKYGVTKQTLVKRLRALTEEAEG